MAGTPICAADWDNYIRVTSAPREPEVRVLLLSNSQGNGPEYPDRAIYPWLLQDALNEGRTGPPVRVVNWSFGPNRVPEAVLLLARAQELKPHLVVAAFHPTWFQRPDYEFQGSPRRSRCSPATWRTTAGFIGTGCLRPSTPTTSSP
jgi:hypothetical protein